jgi:phosphinothricin acetyltransferase
VKATQKENDLEIREATREDAAAIAYIYNQGIEDRAATYETTLRSAEDIQGWFDGTHPIVVAEDDHGEIIAFASTSLYRPRPCYAGIAEFSVYVERTRRGGGVGRATLAALLQEAKEAGFWKLVSRVFVENSTSRALLRSLGFREVGIYYKHARLDGIWTDVVIVERLLSANLA